MVSRQKPFYPANWAEFSLSIRTSRAEGQCECMGECGLHRTHPGPRRCIERNGKAAIWANGFVVLTVAHLCGCDPPCAEESHVKACCQRCHLLIDLDMHLAHATETRRLEKETRGQIPLAFMG